MNRSAYSAILFDFDGTLADSYAAITASVNHVRSLRQLPPLTSDEVRYHVGRGPARLLEATVGSTDIDGSVAAYRAHHPAVMREGTHLLAGVAETLQALQGHGFRLGVCSNKPVDFTRALLASLGIADRFEVVLGPEDVEHPKPAPDMLLAALSRLRLPHADVLYVGDMTVDIATARAAGVTVWVVATGSDAVADLEAAKPDRLLRTMADMLDCLQ